MLNGRGVRQTAKDIMDSPLKMPYSRARRVALTEMLRAHSYAQQEAMLQTPSITHKIWRHTGFGLEPRENHAEMNRQKVEYEKPFILYPKGSNKAEHPMIPRDTNLPAGESVNCHCFVQPVADEAILGYSLEERQKMQAAAIAEDDGRWEKELDAKMHQEADEWRAANFPLNNEKLFMARKVGEDDFAQVRPLTDEEKDRYYGILNNRFENGTPIAKKVYNMYIPEDGGVYNDRYGGESYFEEHSNPKYTGIRMSYLEDLENPRGAGTILFHEQGHLIDSKTGRPSSSQTFRNAIINDVKAYEKFIKESKNLKSIRKARDVIADEFKNNIEKTHGIQDIFGGVKKKRYRDDLYGHEDLYWKNDKNRLNRETFTQMFEASFDPEKRELMKKYLPTAWLEFEKILGGLI